MPTKRKGHDICNAFSAAEGKFETSNGDLAPGVNWVRKPPSEGKRNILEYNGYLVVSSEIFCCATEMVCARSESTPDLKRQIEEIADEEQASISQICELFLREAIEDYDRRLEKGRRSIYSEAAGRLC
jgi:hypothetical protein